ncbi:MAG: Dna2/Cas4 domain-containing protein [Clostridia bacterium]|nr:Dna2/Cas4 domain-containing protein [Clostridia bacterium]
MNNIGGTLYSYFFLCKRKVWLSFHNISFESDSQLVKIGKLLDEESYGRKTKHTFVDQDCVIDFVDNGVVCEVKKR